MKHMNLNIKLLIAFVVLLAGSMLSQSIFRKQHTVSYSDQMHRSVALTVDLFKTIDKLKLERDIKSDMTSNVPYSYMIGDEWSEITTTLGSLEAKEISTNPDFSALVVRLLHEAGIKKGDNVGVVLSGSFPALAVSTLAALQTMDVEALIMSSVGASTYGANQPGATWLDMESALKRDGIHFNTVLVTMGAGEDAGIGLSDEGVAMIRNAAYRNKVDLYVPESLKESINKRVAMFRDANISLLINIGGNETALGSCAHALSIPNGLVTEMHVCHDEDRGLIARMNELGIPFINMLDLKDLATRYGMTISPGLSYPESRSLYNTTVTNRIAIAFILVFSLVPVVFLRKNT